MACLAFLVHTWTLLLLGLSSTYASNCDPTGSRVRFEVLPGRGWDNLRNVDVGQVFAANYSDCDFSDDGRYIIPKFVKLIPRKSSKVQRFSEVFTNYRNYRSLTSMSINMAGHGDLEGKAEVSGTFSAEHQLVKLTQINTRAVTARAQLRHTLYTAIIEAEAPLHPSFRDRLLDMAYMIESNNSLMADYLSDMLVGDYGTHYATRVDAGAVFASLDFVRSTQTSLSDSKLTALKQGAAVNFEDVAGFNRSFALSYGKNDSKGYLKNVTDSTIMSMGGPALAPGAAVDSWVKGIESNLVAIDRNGDPLFYAISMKTLGSLSPGVVSELRLRVKRAVERYYQANTVVGCMERDSDNFNMLANVPSDNCHSPAFNFSFGGVYQTCHGDEKLCKDVTVPNPMTGGYSCMDDFRPVALWSRTYRCRSSCRGWWIFKRCDNLCAAYDLFWCAAKVKSPRQAYLFGGVFTGQLSNPMTGAPSCPPAFYALPMGSSGLQVCLSRDVELGRPHAFEFGGFFSCHAGNPYVLGNGGKLADFLIRQDADSWPKRCPNGFAQHLADIDGACEILYCIRAHALRAARRVQVKRPPFTRVPDGMLPNPPAKPNTISFATAPGQTWIRDPEANSWSYSAEGKVAGGGDSTVAVLASLLGTVCLGLIIVAVFLLHLRRQQSLEARSGVENPNYSGLESEDRERNRSAGEESTGV